ncbi:hypothetical protein [Donghicola tyrosinivorans]|uniref:Uncharacterized protein n=1 Tax=Donghicola tyrosinivorans TaxID=1652492 RepID=A0A2T0WHC6_9RHOB|nr:hypothetical protein [Donghicola tyrosinivorans]MEC9104915.1 hypothetical protein [Pseudomonadota bacterium]MEC9196872.1 hypothetical protein [Pseudomonadota bacterium]MEE3069897.1 hypothetical protein [Pseudomonadota bacterium]PRY86113.1 hypothetical protein CLV74_11388 [Donghicola tyrosinivorans]
MTYYEKLSHMRRDLEAIRAEVCQRISTDPTDKADLSILHERISRAIKALSGQG